MVRTLFIVTAAAACAAWAAEESPPAAWRPFADDSPWNTPVPAGAPVDPYSALYLERLVALGGVSTLAVNTFEWTIPVYWVELAEAPRFDVTCISTSHFNRLVDADRDGVARDVPIPFGAAPDPQDDRHMCVADWRAGVAYDFLQAERHWPGVWRARAVDRWDLAGSGVHPPGVSGCRGSGFPLLAGLIRPEEVAAGEIRHALALAVPANLPYFFVPPASTTDGFATEPLVLPEGTRLQLDPALDLETLALTPAGMVVARALQRYGAYVGDNAGGFALYAQNTPAWGDTFAGAPLGRLDVRMFRVLAGPPWYFQPLDPGGELGPFDLPRAIMVE
jgi:hypothetical protein